MNNVTRYELEIHEGGGEVVTSETGGFVDYDDYLSQLQQTDALQTSLNNIINAFGISGEGAHSKLVIEYVHGLVALAEERREFIVNGVEYDYIELPLFEEDRANATYQRCLLKDSYAAENITAELRAQGVGEFAADMWKRGNELVAESAQKSLVVQVRLAAKLADTYVDNLRAGRKG